MSERRRALPSWMARKEEKVKEKEPLRSRRRRKTARAAFYCMNERELLEAAVSYLTGGACEDAPLRTHQQVEHKAGGSTVKTREHHTISKTTAKPVAEASEDKPSDCSDAQETTYVSETDLDIAEVETVPYTKSPQHQGSEVQDQGGLRDVGLRTEKKEERSRVPADAAEEDDALRLVREIFFT